MKRIYKYPLDVTDIQDVRMPMGAVVLSVAVQRNVICVWAEVDEESASEAIFRRFRIYATGVTMDDHDKYPHFLGTVQLLNGDFVFHVFNDRVEYKRSLANEKR